MRPARPLLVKTPTEFRTYAMDFSKHPEFAVNGETIVSVSARSIAAVSGTPTPPTLGNNQITGAIVQFTATGGQVGKFLIKVLVQTTSGALVQGAGELAIVEFEPISG